MRQIRNALPSAPIVIPILVAAGLAVFATAAAGVVAGIIVGVWAAFAAAVVIESPLKQFAAVTRRIADGDRYAILPRQSPGPLARIAKSVDVLRATVLEADQLAVDQRRREAETRLQMASRSFFTRSFRGAIDDVVKTFTDGSAWPTPSSALCSNKDARA
jgi:methyl-accepting chemotaxis protein